MSEEGGEEESIFVGGNEIAIIHLSLAALAVFLAWKCQNGVNLLHFLLAFCCPYIYIPYVLLVTCPFSQNLPSFFK